MTLPEYWAPDRLRAERGSGLDAVAALWIAGAILCGIVALMGLIALAQPYGGGVGGLLVLLYAGVGVLGCYVAYRVGRGVLLCRDLLITMYLNDDTQFSDPVNSMGSALSTPMGEGEFS